MAGRMLAEGTAGCSEQAASVATCLATMQGQLERLAEMQAETTVMASKLSAAVLQLFQEVCAIRALVHTSECASEHVRSDPALAESIDPARLVCDPRDVLGALVPPPARVLVAEEDVAYQWLINKHLEAHGVDCILVSSALEAVGAIRGGIFDLALIGVGPPGGADAVRRIRAFDRTTPIVGITPSGKSHRPDTVAGPADGCNALLAKPFSCDGLLAVVARFCAICLGPAPPGGAAEARDLAGCAHAAAATATTGTKYVFGTPIHKISTC